MLCCSIAFLVATNLAAIQDNIDPDLVLFSKEKTLYAGAAELLDLPGAETALWSATSRFLLYQKALSNGSKTLKVVNVANRSSIPLELPAGESVNLLSSGWVSKSSRLVIAMGEGEGKALYWVDATTGKAQPLSPWGSYKPITTLLSFSPHEPYAILSALLPGPTVGGAELESQNPAFVERCYLLEGTGGIKELKAPLTGFGVNALWSADGKRAFVKKPLPPDQPSTDEIFELDLGGGEAKPTSEAELQLSPEPYLPAAEVYARIGLSRISNSGTQRDINPLWLETRDLDGPNRILICANAQWAEISPDEKNLAYIADGALLVRRLTEIDRSSYVQAQQSRVRQVAMDEIREIGLAITIFGSENEQLLPPPSTFRDEIRGYIKDERVLDRFVYTFPGGRATELRNPSKMEMGFIPLKDGRVVLYADSSVKWVPL